MSSWERNLGGNSQQDHRYTCDDDVDKERAAVASDPDLSPTTLQEEYDAGGYLRTTTPVGGSPAKQSGKHVAGHDHA